MAKQEELATLLYQLKQEGIELGNYTTTGEGVVFDTYRPAQLFAERHGKELKRIDGKVTKWLAANK